MENNSNNSNPRRKIILVDDVSFHLMSTKERLKKYYEVFPAQSAEDLFELLENVKPELILLDINMPDSDGYETIERLKKDERYFAIPVIFLTSKNDKESINKGMALGAVDFIKKPFTDSDVYDCIEYQLDPLKKSRNKPVILAIDDCPSILNSIKHLLGSEYTVYTLAESKNIKALLKMVTPDLFLLDCKMPVLSGFDLIPIIREHNDYADTPIMFLTSEGTIDTISVAINLGASDFIIKPIDSATLRVKIALQLKDFIIRRRMRTGKK